MTKVCLIVPYSGPLPPWMPLFLQSVERNPCIHLFLISTNRLPHLPANVTQVTWTLKQIEARVQQHINPTIGVPHAYKLCDLKPFYGLMFPDLVEHYDFWGYCDLDLVFGNLAHLINSKRLAETDVFFADSKSVTGHFALYRNRPEINGLALLIPHYVHRLNAIDSKSSDEHGMAEVMDQNPHIRWDMSRSLRESKLTITPQGKMMGRTNGVVGAQHRFFWKSGYTFIRGLDLDAQEVLYLHFMGLKRAWHWTAYDPTRTYEEFSFSAAGFVPWVSPPNAWTDLKFRVMGTAIRALSVARGRIAQAMPSGFRLRMKELLRRRPARGL